MTTVNTEDQSPNLNSNADEEKPINTGRLLGSGSRLPKRDYSQSILGHNPLVSQSEEFERLAREHLRKDGIYPTKNNTILRIIK